MDTKKAGKLRWKGLSAQERAEIASRAVRARWAGHKAARPASSRKAYLKDLSKRGITLSYK